MGDLDDMLQDSATDFKPRRHYQSSNKATSFKNKSKGGIVQSNLPPTMLDDLDDLDDFDIGAKPNIAKKPPMAPTGSTQAAKKAKQL